MPYDFASGRAMVIDMERLILPGAAEDRDQPATQIDPRLLPSITIKAAEFAFGDRFLGAVEASFVRSVDGLLSDSMVARDESFDIVGS